MSLFWELHAGLPREGPGDDEATKHVLSLIPKMDTPRILDIGCGPGMQTLCLARCTDGDIVAVDNHQPFLETLARAVIVAGLAARVATVNASMDALPFGDESFDLIWSEGAIYCMGFESGLVAWRRFLVPRGVLVVSELTWLSRNVPAEPRRFWNEHYPAMLSIDENAALVKKSGYNLLSTYLLPDTAWLKDYYDPLERRIAELCQKYKETEKALSFLSAELGEIALYRQFREIYGYVFYVMQRQ